MRDSVRDHTLTEQGGAPIVGADRAADVTAWWRLWAIATIAHVASNVVPDDHLRLVVNAALGFVALSVAVRPTAGLGRVVLAAGVIASVAVEAPVLGNHWLLAGAISALALMAGPHRSSERWLAGFAPAARLATLVFYGFAAFAKLNSAFFDPVQSCARFFANRTLDFWQLPTIDPGDLLAGVLPVVVAAIELAVPVLLVSRRLRRVGVWLAITFHLALTLDLLQHFFDFTLVLIPLFLLFAEPGTLASFDARLPRPALRAPWMVLAAGVIVGTASTTPTVRGLAILALWVAWGVLAAYVVRWIVLRPPGAGTFDVARPLTAGGAAVVMLLVLNGVSPYLELKTATAFNMYSNLQTADGNSNHLLIRRSVPLRSELRDPVAIIDSNDPDLVAYREGQLHLPRGNLRDHLADRPDVWVELAGSDGATIDIGAGDAARADRHLGSPRPWWARTLATFRSIPADGAACRVTWPVAR